MMRRQAAKYYALRRCCCRAAHALHMLRAARMLCGHAAAVVMCTRQYCL